MTKGNCFNDLFKVRAYMECYTGRRDNTECCKGAGVSGGDQMDPENRGCLAMCDGTRDLPGKADFDVGKCDSHTMSKISQCNAQAYEPTFTPAPKRFTGYPTLMCPATTTVIVSGFKVVNCVHPTPSA
ncbi:hypothetical protein AAVH_35068 [Aphelenchoides avenae]|nr:hypothetical protein AAVH_35068 [Aphelenchus avenae]